MAQEIDIAQELAELRERVRRAPAPASDADLTALQKAIANLNANWYISATLPPPAPNAPLTWRAVYFAKRVARRVMVELLNTVVQQQNAFNLHVARALTELAAQETRVDALEKRVAEMERKSAQAPELK
ncbi:MAG: hypothetical protein BroJett039_04220 [Chloroflexota bacterium]|nr:MAG: hypothetical protein BroJett039_04220 [Chloroflexota bacterium]